MGPVWSGPGVVQDPFDEIFSLVKYMGVSKNGGTPKWMVYKGKPLLKWMIWGYPYFWKHPCI